MKGCILITGACGFIAKHLAIRLNAEDTVNIYGTDIHSVPLKDLKLNYYTVDFRDANQVSDLIKALHPDVVFHLAGLNKGNSSDIYNVNLLGSIYLLEAIRRYSPNAKILLVGSAAEYGHIPQEDMPITETHPCNPIGHYGISKYAMTLSALDYVRSYGMKVVVARPFNIIGAGVPSSLVVGAVLSRVKEAFKKTNDPIIIPIGNLETERDFLSVKDAVDAYISMINGEYWGEVFNICSGEPRSVQYVLNKLLANSKRPIRMQADPALIHTSDVSCVFGSYEKARCSFGFNPQFSLETALKSAWDEAIEK